MEFLNFELPTVEKDKFKKNTNDNYSTMSKTLRDFVIAYNINPKIHLKILQVIQEV